MEGMRCSFTSYEGKEKYIFVSYAHKDGNLVKPILEKLYKAGFRIWYDDGIEWGTEYSEYIAEHLKNCAVCLVFHSRKSKDSQYCKDEIYYALDNKKGILSIYLEDVILTGGLQMRLGSYQSTFWYQYPNADKELFYEKLLKAEILQPCKGEVPKPKHAAEKKEAHSPIVKAVADFLSAFYAPEATRKQAQQTPVVQSAVTECHENKELNIKTAATAEDKIVKFHDADFEKAFRKKYGIKGDITLKTILGFTELDLSESEPKLRDITDVAMFKNLRKLNLYGNAVTDISPLKALINLTRLNLSHNFLDPNKNEVSIFDYAAGSGRKYISDLKPLAGLANLTELDLSGSGTGDLTPLAGLVKLTVLQLDNSIGGNRISDITPLAGLAKLTELTLRHNEIRDITPLAGLVKLTRLNLNRNEISDITPLARLVNLTELHLWGNQISNITPLAGLANLTTLYLSRNQISNITPLAGLANLTVLFLRGNQISDLMPLAGLVNLTQLDLTRNKISDITPLAGLVNLTQLDLTRNKISDITPLAGLAKLTGLFLRGNQISDITPLAGLVRLTELTLRDNEIRDITPLAELVNLTSLYLDDNQIRDITPLAGLINLEGLSLANEYDFLARNIISDLKPLGQLYKLEMLVLTNAAHREIDISPLYNLTALFKFCIEKGRLTLKQEEELHSHLPEIQILSRL